MKKRILVMGTAALMGGATLATGAATFAATSSTPGNVMHRVSDVRAHAKLNQAVRDGVITSEQETAFKAEVKTLRAERKTDGITKSSTSDQKKAERTKLDAALKSWASTNNFPLAKIFPKLAA